MFIFHFMISFSIHVSKAGFSVRKSLFCQNCYQPQIILLSSFCRVLTAWLQNKMPRQKKKVFTPYLSCSSCPFITADINKQVVRYMLAKKLNLSPTCWKHRKCCSLFSSTFSPIRLKLTWTPQGVRFESWAEYKSLWSVAPGSILKWSLCKKVGLRGMCCI